MFSFLLSISLNWCCKIDIYICVCYKTFKFIVLISKMRDIFQCTYQQTLGNLHLLEDAVCCSEPDPGGKKCCKESR